MDSINKNQQEQNHKDLSKHNAIEKIKHLAEEAGICFFCTVVVPGIPYNSRPMSVQEVDDQGNIWFLSAKDSYKNKAIKKDPAVQLYFQGSKHSHLMQLYGRAIISEDKNKIKALWNPILKTWFTAGEEDPNISVIKFEPISGYYWDNKHGNAVAGVKIMIGALLGKTLDDSIEGALKVKKG